MKIGNISYIHVYSSIRIESILGCLKDGSEASVVCYSGISPGLHQHPDSLTPVSQHCHVQGSVAFKVLTKQVKISYLFVHTCVYMYA